MIEAEVESLRVLYGLLQELMMDRSGQSLIGVGVTHIVLRLWSI